MKIYLFNPATGVYLGEDFADEAHLQDTFRMPPDATTIAPPPVERGQIPVFNTAEQRWEIRSCRKDDLPYHFAALARRNEDPTA